MDPNGDISDTFDDEDWVEPIESGKKGPWNDDSAVFEDPKLANLKKSITEPQQTDYQQRRLQELQKRGVKGKAGKQAPPTPVAAPDSDLNTMWGEPTPVWDDSGTLTTAATEGEWRDRRSPDNVPDPDSPGSAIVHARRITDRIAPEELPEEEPDAPVATSFVISYVPSILAAIVVFVAVTIVHGLLVGWQIDLLYRGLAAMVVAGILWRRFQAGRLRAMVIAAATYGVLFVPSDRLDEPQNLFAVFLGLLIALAGAGMIGVQRDEVGA
tara:strand:- start:26243 stop:27049 length:807 start_codon:yes stop_codon:yes gene_type:complete